MKARGWNRSCFHQDVFSSPHLSGPQVLRAASKVVFTCSDPADQARGEEALCGSGRPAARCEVHDIFFSSDWDLCTLGTCLLHSLFLGEIHAELQQSEDGKSSMCPDYCFWPRGREIQSTRPLIILCGRRLGNMFILGCGTTIIHSSQKTPIPIFVF